MQDRLKDIVANLGVAEKDVVEKNFLEKLSLWARLIDEVEAGLPYIRDLSNTTNHFNQTKSQYEQILNHIAGMNIAQDAGRVTQVQQYFNQFRQYLNQLIDLKQKINTLTEDTTDIAALKRVVSDAKKQRVEFEKSFKDNLEQQASGSQRVLATYFKKRLTELKKNEETSPIKWLERRHFWFKTLLIVIACFAASFIIVFALGWLKGYEIQLALLKVAVVTLLYLQYHFATRNYNIYADLVAKYEHLAVISETMTDFTAASFDNEELNNAVYVNAAKTLFSEVGTGHLKQQTNEPSVIENIINQMPRSN